MIEIFSYWIFIWFILYYINFIKYNPLFILLCGYIFTIFELIYLSTTKISNYNLIKFFIINIIIKFFPIILIIKIPIIINLIDIYISIYLFIIYYITIIIFYKKTPYYYYKNMINTYIEDNNKYKSYISMTYDYIYNYLIK
jgi:hypothetical protein